MFLAFAVYYGICLYPGVGGQINAGDSAKFQILAHAQIMVHGPGYPFYLMLASLIRALELPFSGWWIMSFALSALPGAAAVALAFLIAHRLTDSFRIGIAAALILGSAHLMAVQATEAEVYALNLAFVLATLYLMILFIETERLGYFLAACAIYALSFGNHLMMAMLLPLFVAVTAWYRRMILRPYPAALVALFIALGASQYIYLAHVAYNPSTAYSEYMPLPPTVGQLLHYVGGTYFNDLYGSGLHSPKNMEVLAKTLHGAHPWISVPLIAAGALVFIGRGRRWRDRGWWRLAVLFAGALCFLPFVLWYGAWDIEAFQLPVIALLLLAAVASLGWAARKHLRLFSALAAALLLVGVIRTAETGLRLGSREPRFAGLLPHIEASILAAPGRHPVVPLDYDTRMAVMYYGFLGKLPHGPDYRLYWRLPYDVDRRRSVEGLLMPARALGFLERLRQRRPDMHCLTWRVEIEGSGRWPVYRFHCHSGERIVI